MGKEEETKDGGLLHRSRACHIDLGHREERGRTTTPGVLTLYLTVTISPGCEPMAS